MLGLSIDDHDDPSFLAIIKSMITGIAELHRPGELRIFKIDHWFDDKWVGFAGKISGAAGIRQSDPVVVPPFTQNRIRGCSKWVRDDRGYRYEGDGPEIHHVGWSPINQQEPLRHDVPDGALFWFSGDTAATDHGSLMGYVPIEDDWWMCYVGYVKIDEWKISKRVEITEDEIAHIRNRPAISMAT